MTANRLYVGPQRDGQVVDQNLEVQFDDKIKEETAGRMMSKK